MENHTEFSYTYSATVNREVHEIRNKYMPRTESKLDELKRLDSRVQVSGMAESLSLGILGLLLFGLGVCLSMHIIGHGILLFLLGIALAIIGAAGMILAYPVHHTVFSKTKTKLTPRILQLASELSGENI